ncbi:uncharacterized protein MONBRDRAFT_8266 [Monosiga brevicollis MX1]|uniref:Uncharacterized protein n=1 Tax=Monosiga brevicollis TaxID=81824 RepID=A9UZJ2_MONBE|nr:uncharacterized protein MONBRDRAFT_8266 [Monosiga brevicollis MX1]EDQ89240.1 predicted protein [Monosiga brevicollis MX1]|eukprot:XP_001745816.1 hypothetical protein [Monosiga brevicollis MX1]
MADEADEVARLQAYAKRIEELEAEVRLIVQENDELLNENEEQDDPVLHRTTAQYERILADLNRQHEEEVEVVHRELARERQKMARQHEQLEAANSGVSEAKALLQDLRRRLDVASRAKRDLESRNMTLEEQLDEARAQNQAYSAHLKQVLEKVADKRQQQLLDLGRVAEQSRRQRNEALQEASRRDEELQILAEQMRRQQADV